MSELTKIWNLIKTGSVENKKRSPFQMSIFIGKILLILLVFKIISLGLISFLSWLGVFEIPLNLIETGLESFSEIEILILASIYAPILEELSFRLPLKLSKWNLTIASIGLSLSFCRVLAELKYEYSLILSITVGIIVYLVLNEKRLKNILDFSSKNKLPIFYSFLLIFSFLHLKNYELTIELLIFSPIFLLPRILDGILLSYIRLNSGILSAILFHSFNNSFFSIIEIIAK
ncbi:CPBP family intramembrane metalloprotease [Tenacibaculum dicentrarchi]|uniref:CPBP family glutamic-type intramembrane protease n=1 Tax=Tenacibaculum dicentrarchi TaxID=669041 RepID=UPI0013566616|nr:CPBP family intramembrane metalloprotease [Tenacibaculum dicentrarchi]